MGAMEQEREEEREQMLGKDAARKTQPVDPWDRSTPGRENNTEKLPSLEDHLAHAELGWYQGKIFLMASLLVAADGMEMTVISLLRKPLSKEWGLNDNEFSALGSTVFAGLLIGNLMGGFLADMYGRKHCMIGVSLLFCIFGVLSALASNVWIFAVARFFTGMGVGSMVPVSDSHLLEWSPSASRAKIAMTLTGVAFAFGAAFACVAGIWVHDIGGEEWWRWMLLVCILPGLVSLPLCYFFLPESPHFLMVHGRVEETEVLLRQLAECNGKPPLRDGRVAHFHSPVESCGGWKPLEIFGRELRATSIYCTVVWCVCGFTYYGHIFVYPVLLEDIYNMQVKEAYSTVLISTLVEISAVVGCMVLMDIEGIGRRGAMALGFLFAWLAASLIPLSQNLTQFIALNSALRGIIEGPFTMIYIFAGELFPTTHRGTAVAFCNSFGRIAAMVSPMVCMELYHIHYWYPFFLFGTLSFGGLLSSAFFTRETLNEPLIMYTDEVERDAGVPRCLRPPP
eukprot:CAMPEP_0181314324 /NCGR_PEP_ID=MMETSP1101-20121128/14754_1 /TAXON_ID=46948 /ORGANISM="Rhodomonas abbreviata, Strain Caron Lab Isolate" /LENGTH=509 /DNA_ID=CAMNT_0023421403 /DNA_START=195 /DNA_END=1720 /DNA_ORIENTATION=-